MLSIVIITRDTKELLEQLLRSIEKDGSLTVSLKEAIIIDNASVDGTGDMVRSEFPWATYVRNDRNLGFAASANQGIGRSTGKYALLLNSDTILIEGEIMKMLAFMEAYDDVGICGPQLVFPDMRPQRSSASIPSLLTELLPFLAPRSSPLVPCRQHPASSIQHPASSIQHPASSIKHPASPSSPPSGSSPHASRLTPHDPSSSLLSALDVPSIIGAAMMIRRSLFQELSGFDEQFFFFLEETDLCLRAQQQTIDSRQSSADNSRHPASRIEHPGSSIQHRASSIQHPVSSSPPSASRLTPYRVVLLPDAKVIHLQGKTVGKNWIKGRIEYNISLYKFIRKHHSPLYYRSFQAVRLSKSFTVILVLSLLPFLLIGTKIRRRYVYYWQLFLWHLAACPPTAGLRS